MSPTPSSNLTEEGFDLKEESDVSWPLKKFGYFKEVRFCEIYFNVVKEFLARGYAGS